MSQPIPAVTAYFDDIRQSLGIGVPETSGYPALRNVLHAVGESLKPKIAPVIHPKNKRADIPDGGLFSARELKRYADGPALNPGCGLVSLFFLAQIV